MQQDRLWNEWHPVCKAEELGDDPKQVQVLGERVVIFRNEKGVHAFKDLCIPVSYTHLTLPTKA